MAANKKCLTVVAMLTFLQCLPQTPYLERTVSISIINEPIDQALKKISEKGGFVFSYNPSILREGQVVNENFVNKTIRQILDQLFNGTVTYKQRGKYIILTQNEFSSSQNAHTFSGYIIDESTGERLRDVSVYDPVSLSSAVTDDYGYFEIEIPDPPSDLKLAVKKQNYTDTLININRTNRLVNIPIKFDTKKIATFSDSVGVKLKRFWKTKILAPPRANMDNIRDTLYRKTQFSFVPFIGTNHALSGNIVNDFSLNLLGGYSMGVRKVEVGGLFNFVRGDVKGAQIAGIYNHVGGSLKGAQIAGIFNMNHGATRGAQVAGIYNMNLGEAEKFSAAGIFNFAKQNSSAVQVAGIANMTIKDQKYPHMAGILNVTAGESGGQFAGIINVAAKNVRRGQLAGIINVAGKNLEGVQFAGIANFTAKQVRGAQVSGILNFAKKVRGAQFGLINISDSISGVPIGLLTIVMKGYHKIEISADEIFYTNLSFRTGVRKFYNILTVGARPETFGDTATHWTFGYGIGTAPRISEKVALNLDLTSNQIAEGKVLPGVNMINKAFAGVDIQLGAKTSLAIGATLNMRLMDTKKDDYRPLFDGYEPKIFFDRTYRNDINVTMWLGGKIGLRFL